MYPVSACCPVQTNTVTAATGVVLELIMSIVLGKESPMYPVSACCPVQTNTVTAENGLAFLSAALKASICFAVLSLGLYVLFHLLYWA